MSDDRPIGARLDHLLSGIRFGKFASVGVVGALFDNAVLATLKLGFDVAPELAKVAGIETAIVVMFLVNDNWTFAAEGDAGVRPLFRRLFKSHVVRAGGVAVQLTVFWLLLNRTDVTVTVAGEDLWFLVASVVAIGIAMLVNYTAESLFTWRVGAREHD